MIGTRFESQDFALLFYDDCARRCPAATGKRTFLPYALATAPNHSSGGLWKADSDEAVASQRAEGSGRGGEAPAKKTEPQAKAAKPQIPARLLAAVRSVLEDADDTGRTNSVVVGATAYNALREVLYDLTGQWWGMEVEELDDEENEDSDDEEDEGNYDDE